jgi:two-component system, NtrC family, response regulator AtoC
MQAGEIFAGMRMAIALLVGQAGVLEARLSMEASVKHDDRLTPGELPDDSAIFGVSWAMAQARRKIDELAPMQIPVLIRGESGTGKEVLAKYIHLHSTVKSGPFVKVNCAAIPGPLLESELFGYEKGAFTGAVCAKLGKVEMAAGGTLFLDEIGEIDPTLQTKLLHFLHDRSFCRLGGRDMRRADVRIVCATNCDLERAIASGNFRQDLFYRIDVIGLHVPPLRERLEDLECLSIYLQNRLSVKLSRTQPPLSIETLRVMRRWRWPGNIRELENWMARYLVMGGEPALREELHQRLPDDEAETPRHLKPAAKQAVLAMQKEMILRSLDAHHWNRRRVARDLQISYRALLYKIREAGIAKP